MSPRSPSTRARAARTAPSFRELSRDECVAMLGRNHVGRIAFAFRDRVDIQPISFAYEDDRLFGRTEPGDKLVTLRHSPWVAFEVDETEGTFDWRSVVVRGTFYLLPADGSPAEQRTRERALALLQDVIPETGTDDDPVPFRDVVFEVVVDTVSGREATTRPET